MSRILITGGNGGLGHALLPLLDREKYTLRIMSRRPRPASTGDSVEWAQADLATGEGVEAAMQDVQIVAHLASNAFNKPQLTDVEGTRRLLQISQRQGVENFVYISIVGIEHFPHYPYYQAKLEAEQLIEASGVPYTILRATQFHSLIDIMLNLTRRLPFHLMLLDAKFQPIDTGEAAAHLARYVMSAPVGRAPDIGGPEVLTGREMAQVWRTVRGIRKPLFNLWLPGRTISIDSFRKGLNTAPDRAVGKITWAEWVQQQYGMDKSPRPLHSPRQPVR